MAEPTATRAVLFDMDGVLTDSEPAKAAGMRCIAVAHTFPADRLVQADLVKARIDQLTVSEILEVGSGR